MAASEKVKSFWRVGEAYLIRTVTMIDTGILVSIDEHEIVLKDAAWIADTGRFNEALKTLNFSEVEPFPDGLVTAFVSRPTRFSPPTPTGLAGFASWAGAFQWLRAGCPS